MTRWNMTRLIAKRSIKTTAIVAVGVAALSTGIAQAGDDQILDACIHEFIASNLSGYQGNISVQKLTPAQLSPLITTHREVVVSASRAHGSDFASAVCHVDREGKVTSLTLTSSPEKLSRMITPAVVVGAN